MTQDQFTDTAGTSTNGDTSNGATFKKSDASSFTQITSEFQSTKNSQDNEKENNANFGN